jgi:signal transduction histidine kinase/AmiR/NasT family two-component response regulator
MIVAHEPILVATLDVEHGHVLSRFLAEHGFRPVLCRCSEVRQSLHEVRPRLLILGHCQQDGLALLQDILQQFPRVRIIALVEPHENDRIVDLLEAGASDVLVKPVGERVLMIAVKRALDILDLQEQCDIVREKNKILRMSQQMCRQLFDEVPCYVSVQNKDWRIVRANRHFKEDFGDCLGEHCYEIYKHRTHPCPNCPVEATFADGLMHQTEEVVTTRSGQQKIVLTMTAPIRHEHGKIIEVMELSTDISQIRELQSRLTSLGLFIGSISHGVRGMLTALDGGMYRLEKGIENGDMDRIRAGAELVKLMVARIRNSVLEMLYYSKDRELNIQSIDLRSFADNVANFVAPKAEKHGITFIRDCHENIGMASFDPEVISSGLVNILENAVDACIEDEAKPEHSVRFAVSATESEVCFTVQDNGTGIDRQTQEKMFSLFFSSKGSRGTGLGLYIANEVVQQHGGRIEVHSVVGEGTEFRVYLPRQPRQHTTSAS